MLSERSLWARGTSSSQISYETIVEVADALEVTDGATVQVY